MLNYLLSAEEAGSCFGDSTYMWVIIGVVALLFFGWTFLSNRKRGKQINDMRNILRVGDEVMTIGGIVGTIVEVREKNAIDKEFVIETGKDGSKSTMVFDIRALGENRTRIKEIQAEAAKQAEIARQQKEAKKLAKNPDSVLESIENKSVESNEGDKREDSNE